MLLSVLEQLIDRTLSNHTWNPHQLQAREVWAGLSVAWVFLKLMIGVIFLFIDCHEFQNVLGKLEYSDIYMAEMVRDTCST